MTVSIVMTYFNRREQLLRTLASIRYFGSPEIIVVDDGSEDSQRIDDLKGITLIRIEPKDKTWKNTCIPYNIGFASAKSDIVLIQNAECLHTGNILGYCQKLTKGTMFSFGAYSLDHDLPYSADNLPMTELRGMILNSIPRDSRNGHIGWYNHSIHRPVGYHFCNAIMRSDLEEVGGFDERYKDGLAYEDNEFLARVKRAGIEVPIIDDPFVIHQKHTRTDYRNNTAIINRNKELYQTVTLRESLVKAPENSYYGYFRNTATTTHVPLIRTVLELFKPEHILELGVGYYSTPHFLNYARASGGRATYRGIENNISWIHQMKSKCTGADIEYHDMDGLDISVMLRDLTQHRKDQITAYYRSLVIPPVKNKLLFVDNYGSCRVLAINTLKDQFDYIILHDCELAGAMMYSYDRIDTRDFEVFYLKNNLSWTMLMVRKGIDYRGIYETIAPYIAEHIEGNPSIEWMTLTQNYL